MTHQHALEALRRQYFWLDSNFDELYQHCLSRAERTALRAAYVGSRDNLREARLRVFIDRDPTAGLLLTELQTAMGRVEALAASKFSEGLVSEVASAVNAGSRLVACASSTV